MKDYEHGRLGQTTDVLYAVSAAAIRNFWKLGAGSSTVKDHGEAPASGVDDDATGTYAYRRLMELRGRPYASTPDVSVEDAAFAVQPRPIIENQTPPAAAA